MTLKNLYNHKYTKNMLKHYTWIIWMSLLLNGLCTVLPMSLAITESMQSGVGYGSEYLLVSNIALYIVALAGAKITATSMFKYLNNKSEVDFYHSVPIKKNSLFFSRYMAGVTAYLTGLKIAYFTAIIIGLMTGILEFNQIGTMFVSLVSIILTFLSTYAFVVLGTVVTGNIFMAMATAFGIMFSPIIFTVLITNLCDVYLFSYATSGITYVNTILKWTNPCFTVLSPLLGYKEGTAHGIFPLFIIWIMVTAVAFISFMKRKSESAGEPVALPFFRPIIKGLGVTGASLLCGFVFAYENPMKFYVVSFIIGLVFHIAFEMLFAGDVKAGLNKIKHYPFYYAIVAVIFIVISLDLTGYDKHIVPLEDIKSITYNGVVLEDRENIEILYTWMEESIANDGFKGNVETEYKVELGDDFYSYDNLQLRTKGSIYETVNVNLNNNSSYIRNYEFHNVSIEDLATIETSKEYLNHVLDYELSAEDIDSIRNHTNNRPWVDLNNSAMELSVDTFLSAHALLAEQQELLTAEYISANTPVLAIRIYIEVTGESKYFYVYDIHQEVIKLLDVKMDPLTSDTKIVMGDIYSDVLSEMMDSTEKEWENNYSEYSGYSVNWTQKELDRVSEIIKPIYGHSSLFGNYNQNNKPLIFFQNNNSEYIGYITVEELMEIF